jgi:hypothetical protein
MATPESSCTATGASGTRRPLSRKVIVADFTAAVVDAVSSTSLPTSDSIAPPFCSVAGLPA